MPRNILQQILPIYNRLISANAIAWICIAGEFSITCPESRLIPSKRRANTPTPSPVFKPTWIPNLANATPTQTYPSTLALVRDLFEIALKSKEIQLGNRSIYFYFEQVATIYQDDIEAQIREQVDIVEAIFEDELRIDTGDHSLVFFITNRRIMERDVGGANIGSFVWLPLEYSLGYGQQWPDGVRESTVRHEIVHAFMNHVSTSPIEHAYPKVFTEGIALYLSDNRIIEFHRRTQVRLSDEYIDFLRSFEYMEDQAGRRAVLSFIRDMLTGATLNFSQGFRELTGASYAEYSAKHPSITERAIAFIQSTLRIPRRWQRYISVFGALGLIAVLFLTVHLPKSKREEVRRNISVAALTFVIIAFLTQGRLIELAARNYLPFISPLAIHSRIAPWLPVCPARRPDARPCNIKALNTRMKRRISGSPLISSRWVLLPPKTHTHPLLLASSYPLALRMEAGLSSFP